MKGILLIIILILLSTIILFSEEIYIEEKADLGGGEITYDWNAYEGPYKLSEEEFYEKIGLHKLSAEIKRDNRRYSTIGWGSLGLMLASSAAMFYPITIDQDEYDNNMIHLGVQFAGLTGFFSSIFIAFWADGHKNHNKTPYTYAKNKLNEYENN